MNSNQFVRLVFLTIVLNYMGNLHLAHPIQQTTSNDNVGVCLSDKDYENDFDIALVNSKNLQKKKRIRLKFFFYFIFFSWKVNGLTWRAQT